MSHLDLLMRKAEIKKGMAGAITTEEWRKLSSDVRAEILLTFERISRLITEPKP